MLGDIVSLHMFIPDRACRRFKLVYIEIFADLFNTSVPKERCLEESDDAFVQVMLIEEGVLGWRAGFEHIVDDCGFECVRLVDVSADDRGDAWRDSMTTSGARKVEDIDRSGVLWWRSALVKKVEGCGL